MKVSDIKIEDIAEYIKEEFADLSQETKNFLNTALAAAKAFIRSYTGIKDLTITGEKVATADGITTAFFLSESPIVENSLTLYLNGTALVENTDYYLIDAKSGKIAFRNVPQRYSEITADYKIGLDAYEEFPIVVYVLTQDMYDTRSLYVDKANLNTLVDSILGMHCKNLL